MRMRITSPSTCRWFGVVCEYCLSKLLVQVSYTTLHYTTTTPHYSNHANPTSNTQYHLVIGVVCMFFYLVKTTMWLLHIFLPIFSLLLHIPLLIIWAYGIHIQTSPDTIDPEHTNKGAPWYITKSCDIVEDKQVRGYCMQAKSAFAVSVIMVYVSFFFSFSFSFSSFHSPHTLLLTPHQRNLRPLHRPNHILLLPHPLPAPRTKHQARRKESRQRKMGNLLLLVPHRQRNDSRRTVAAHVGTPATTAHTRCRGRDALRAHDAADNGVCGSRRRCAQSQERRVVWRERRGCWGE
jgi:hypothetical protein